MEEVALDFRFVVGHPAAVMSEQLQPEIGFVFGGGATARRRDTNTTDATSLTT